MSKVVFPQAIDGNLSVGKLPIVAEPITLCVYNWSETIMGLSQILNTFPLTPQGPLHWLGWLGGPCLKEALNFKALRSFVRSLAAILPQWPLIL